MPASTLYVLMGEQGYGKETVLEAVKALAKHRLELVVLRDSLATALASKPVITALPLEALERFEAEGHLIRRSFLYPIDLHRDRPIPPLRSFPFVNGPVLVNNFALYERTRLLNAEGRALPYGAVIAAIDWLHAIALYEGWPRSFIPEPHRLLPYEGWRTS